MNIVALISKLKELAAEHGDHEVLIVDSHGNTCEIDIEEYSVRFMPFGHWKAYVIETKP